MKRTVILVVLLVAALILLAGSSPDVLLTVSPDPVPLGKNATLTLDNASGEYVTLTNEAPWSIYDFEGALIFTPVYASGEDSVPPGESRSWTWDQARNDAEPLYEGIYEARLTFRAESGATVILTTTFEVEEK